MPTHTTYQYRPSRSTYASKAPLPTPDAELPTYGSYLWRVIKDSVHGYSRVRNWSEDCQCNCCPHNIPEPFPKSYSSKFAGTSASLSESRHHYPRHEARTQPPTPTQTYRQSYSTKTSKVPGGFTYSDGLRSDKRGHSVETPRLRLDVVDNTHCELGRRHGTVLSMVVEKGSTAKDIIEALTTHRQKIIIHWKARGQGSEELTSKITTGELARYASWMEIRRCKSTTPSKRVHWG